VPGSAAGIGRICTEIQGGEFSPALWIELSVLRFGVAILVSLSTLRVERGFLIVAWRVAPWQCGA
jgi:hypothetical protein